MDRIDALRAHLLTLPPSRVLALLRELPRDMVDAAGTPQELLPSLADALQRAVVFETLTAAQYELLAAAADIAEAESDRPRSHSWTESRYLPFLGVSPAVSVDPQALLEQVSAADGPQRQVAERVENRAAGDVRPATLDQLVERFAGGFALHIVMLPELLEDALGEFSDQRDAVLRVTVIE